MATAEPNKLKHNGNRCGSWHAQGIEKVEEQDVGDHHCHKNDHDLVKIEFPGNENPLSGYLHHTA